MSALLSYCWLSLLLLAARDAQAWDAKPFNPASVPLAVRSPYVSTWLPQGKGTALNDAWATFYTGGITAWAGFITVDDKPYSFMGVPGADADFEKATQKSVEITSTQSIYVMTAGAVDLTVTFLSPVEPTDLVKQSIPLSYMSLSAASNDGSAHSVQVYTDISAEWLSPSDGAQPVNWTLEDGDVLSHTLSLQTQLNYEENHDMIRQGSVYYSTAKTDGLTHMSGPDKTVRTLFVNSSALDNSQDTTFRNISDSFPVFAFAHDLGDVKDATDPIAMSIGLIREPAVQYVVGGNKMQDRSLFFWTEYGSVGDLIKDFLGDYKDALSRAQKLDEQIDSDASAISNDYASITALSVRQALAALEITTPCRFSVMADALAEISSNGNTNTVDVIFPMWPLLMYLNPALGKYILLPALKYQATGQYPNKYSVHDMGAHFPKAIGHNDGKDEAMPVEECGNMLIMALSYTQKASDHSLINDYVDAFDQWTQFLVNEALVPASQLSTDDFAGHLENQTNLAIKGILGIKAMSEIANTIGDKTAGSKYSDIASDYVSKWQDLAKSSEGGHTTLNYGNDSSWGLTYNLYADKLLGFNLFPSSIYDQQTAFYQKHSNTFGVPLDSRHTYTKSDWEIWTAAIMSDTDTRDMLISAVAQYAANGQNDVPFSDWYETTDGKVAGFRARPVVGGHFALVSGALVQWLGKSDADHTLLSACTVSIRVFVVGFCQNLTFPNSNSSGSGTSTADPSTSTDDGDENAGCALSPPFPFTLLRYLLQSRR
uniref:Glutaminase A n=1 Tax=Schizophyllum commune (strain H4-8 / FGSC 9210) TaxID=578458 RepID=D8PPI6_SCHCM